MIFKSLFFTALLFFCGCDGKKIATTLPTKNLPVADENWTKTKSGLMYQVIKEGQGVKPTASSIVTVHYEGQLMDGSVFDSSIARGEPISFPLGRVIAGWTEGLQLMETGATYAFKIPPDLAYGSQATGPIPGNSTLVFKVQLLSIQK
jgi:FKBP-type peptidyl-prolyl cis-trans isomerase FkpA